MGLTRSELREELGLLAGTFWSEAEMNGALNRAIDSAWPQICQIKEDDSITLATGYYTYALTETDITEKGIYQVWIERTNARDLCCRRVLQDCVDGQWRLHFPADHISSYNGQGVIAKYHARWPRLTDDSTETEIPGGYLVHYGAVSLATGIHTTKSQHNVDGYREMIPVWLELADRLKAQHRTVGLTRYVGFMRA